MSSPVYITFPVLDTMSHLLRSNNWHAKVAMRNNELVAILPSGSPLLGLAVDVGTTKLAVYLCDLSTGTILAKSGAMNPQTAFGEDVISRISYTNIIPNGYLILQGRLIETINTVINELCVVASKNNPSINPQQIVEAVVVGNTAMHHLFAGLPVHQLGVAPYVPSVSEPLELFAHHIGLTHLEEPKYICPPISPVMLVQTTLLCF